MENIIGYSGSVFEAQKRKNLKIIVSLNRSSNSLSTSQTLLKKQHKIHSKRTFHLGLTSTGRMGCIERDGRKTTVEPLRVASGGCGAPKKITNGSWTQTQNQAGKEYPILEGYLYVSKNDLPLGKCIGLNGGGDEYLFYKVQASIHALVNKTKI